MKWFLLLFGNWGVECRRDPMNVVSPLPRDQMMQQMLFWIFQGLILFEVL